MSQIVYLLEIEIQPGTEVQACGPSYSGGRGERVAQAQAFEATVSCDSSSALQPGQ